MAANTVINAGAVTRRRILARTLAKKHCIAAFDGFDVGNVDGSNLYP